MSQNIRLRRAVLSAEVDFVNLSGFLMRNKCPKSIFQSTLYFSFSFYVISVIKYESTGIKMRFNHDLTARKQEISIFFFVFF